MGFRLFGKTRDDDEGFSCAECGRTLLAGEFRQRQVDDDGRERYLCSLCARGGSAEPVATDELETTPAGTGRVRTSRSDSDAFWRVLKEKDAEIERLESLLARAEAEKQELNAELARQRGFDGASHEVALTPKRRAPRLESPLDTLTPPPIEMPAPAPYGEAPDGEPVAAGESPADDLRPGPESTDPRLGEALRAAAAAQTPDPEAGTAPEMPLLAADMPATMDDAPDDETLAEAPVAEAAAVAPPPPFTPLAPTLPTGGAVPAVDDRAAPDAAVDEASLTILQRGVDLLNVSAVPRRIVETNESLGIPTVHVGSADDGSLLVTFLWSLGWYQFHVELGDGGRITLAERGYEARTDLPTNASVRADGTVQIAPAMIRATTTRPEPPAHDAGPPSAPTTTSGVIISKSMMGQRTDDENAQPWGTANAPDFDWGR